MADDYSRYYDNIQAEINKRKKTNPNDPSIKELEKYRQAKIDVTNEANSVGAKTVDPNYVMNRYLGSAQQYTNNMLGAGVGSNKLNIGGGIVVQPSGGINQSQIDQYIRDMSDAQRRNQLAALDKAYQNALTGLDTYKVNSQTALDKSRQDRLNTLNTGLTSTNTALDTEQAGIAPTYYDQRNRVASAADVSGMNFAQYMASRGIKGAAGAMPTIYQNAATNQQVGAIDRDEAAANADIARRRSEAKSIYDQNLANVENAYSTDIAGLMADYEARRLGYGSAYESDKTAANADTDSQMLQALIEQFNANRDFALREGDLTGVYNGSLSGLNLDNITAGTSTLAARQQEADNAYRDKLFDYNKETDQRDYDYQVSRDQVLDDQWMQQFSYQEKKDILNRALQSRQISNDEHRIEVDKINRLNDLNQRAIDDYADTIDRMFVSEPNVSNGYSRVIDKDAVADYLEKLELSGIPSSVIDSLLLKYSLPLGR